MAASLDPRFFGQYEAGKQGRPLFDPQADYSEFFLHRGAAETGRGSGGGALALGGILLLLALAIGAWAFYKSRHGGLRNALASLTRGMRTASPGRS